MVGEVAIWNRILNRLVERRGRALMREEIAHAEADLKLEERMRLAVKLHDTLAQNLTGVSLQIDAAEMASAKDPPSARPHLARARMKMPKESLISAIRDVASGTRVIAPEIRRALDEDNAMPELTPRQLDILDLLARGFTNKDMARQFGLSTAGIKFHLLTIFRRLGAANRAEAVNIALRKHLLKA